jgi:hypothetical protein
VKLPLLKRSRFEQAWVIQEMALLGSLQKRKDIPAAWNTKRYR